MIASWFRKGGEASRDPYLYFESPPVTDAAARRILLVSYTFPPDPEVGGLRWQQMARHFGEQGWTLDVLTRDFRDSVKLDPARLERLPPGTRIFSVPAEPPIMLRIQRVIWPAFRRAPGGKGTQRDLEAPRGSSRPPRGRGWFLRLAYLAWLAFARDGKWARAAARAGVRLSSREKYRVVISSGPPHMAHEGARRISTSAHLPHVMDMRDPWSLVQRLNEEVASPVWRMLADRFERKCVRNAALVVMNTEASRDAMRVAYPDHAGKIEVIRNGCDDEELPPRPPHRDGRFTIRFAGSIYIDRDPRLVFRAAARIIRELGLTPSQFAIEFIGDVDKFDGTPTMQLAREEGVEEYVSLGGLLKRRAALEFLAGATVLLSLPQDSDFAIPAKIYEYLRFDAWMLVLAHEGSPTASLLEGTDADVLEPADVEGIVSAILHRYDQFSRGELPLATGRDGRFDRRVQSEKLMRLIDKIASPN